MNIDIFGPGLAILLGVLTVKFPGHVARFISQLAQINNQLMGDSIHPKQTIARLGFVRSLGFGLIIMGIFLLFYGGALQATFP
jgi:hypothetical protein